jgi:hypothetical protein
MCQKLGICLLGEQHVCMFSKYYAWRQGMVWRLLGWCVHHDAGGMATPASVSADAEGIETAACIVEHNESAA